jgi:predicted transglutaminase-like cysteine proteinase
MAQAIGPGLSLCHIAATLEAEMATRFWIILTLLASMLAPAAASPRLLESIPAPPLPAWTNFCERHPDECEIDALEPETITFTQELYAQLKAINVAVNRMLTPMTDENHWGVTDLWSFPDDNIGDCEDFQLLKRRLLIAAGLPRRALRMTVVLDVHGAGHAVLTVRTDTGDFILDNITDKVLAWSETSYTFIKRESDRRAEWVFLMLEPTDAVIVTAQK